MYRTFEHLKIIINIVFQEVVNFVRLRLSQGMEPEDICEDLMTRCLAPDCQMGGLGCDNMTVVLVCFTHYGSWRQVIKNKFNKLYSHT